jgi:uncharacterized OB-fold protein
MFEKVFCIGSALLIIACLVWSTWGERIIKFVSTIFVLMTWKDDCDCDENDEEVARIVDRIIYSPKLLQALINTIALNPNLADKIIGSSTKFRALAMLLGEITEKFNSVCQKLGIKAEEPKPDGVVEDKTSGLPEDVILAKCEKCGGTLSADGSCPKTMCNLPEADKRFAIDQKLLDETVTHILGKKCVESIIGNNNEEVICFAGRIIANEFTAKPIVAMVFRNYGVDGVKAMTSYFEDVTTAAEPASADKQPAGAKILVGINRDVVIGQRVEEVRRMLLFNTEVSRKDCEAKRKRIQEIIDEFAGDNSPEVEELNNICKDKFLEATTILNSKKKLAGDATASQPGVAAADATATATTSARTCNNCGMVFEPGAKICQGCAAPIFQPPKVADLVISSTSTIASYTEAIKSSRTPENKLLTIKAIFNSIRDDATEEGKDLKKLCAKELDAIMSEVESGLDQTLIDELIFDMAQAEVASNAAATAKASERLCNQCGAAFNPGAKACTACGAVISPPQKSAVEAPAPSATTAAPPVAESVPVKAASAPQKSATAKPAASGNGNKKTKKRNRNGKKK